MKGGFDVNFHGSSNKLSIACFDQEKAESHDQILKVRSRIRAKFDSFRRQQLFIKLHLEDSNSRHSLSPTRPRARLPVFLW
jgi:hypothetical protein